MAAAPFFSIVIPSYNRGNFISGIIDRCLQQTISDFEVIIVDDGSIDNTRAIVEQYTSRDARIRYIYQANAERGAARNNGIRNATGKFIVLIDSDDFPLPDYLANLSIAIEQHPQHFFYACHFGFQLENGSIVTSDIEKRDAGIMNYLDFLHGNPLACNFCIRNSAEVILFEEDRGLATMEDWIFLVKNLHSKSLYLSNKRSLLMQQHEGRSMNLDQLLIERRIKATSLLESALQFSEKELQLLRGNTWYFCAIHSYSAGDRKKAFSFLKKAIREMGLQSKFFILGIKSLVGVKNINKIRRK